MVLSSIPKLQITEKSKEKKKKKNLIRCLGTRYNIKGFSFNLSPVYELGSCSLAPDKSNQASGDTLGQSDVKNVHLESSAVHTSADIV